MTWHPPEVPWIARTYLLHLCQPRHSTAAATPLAPPTASNPPGPVPACLRRELAHKGNEKMPGRTRGESHALRDVSRKFSHRHGLLSMANHGAPVLMLAIRQSINGAVRVHSTPNDSPDLPIGPASDFTLPNSVDMSTQADVWQHSMDKELGGVPLHQLRRSYYL